MKVAQIVVAFPPEVEASGIVCYHNSLELVKLGHQVTVFTAEYPDSGFSYPDGLKVKRFKPLFRVGMAPCIPHLATISGFDILHLHYPYHFGGELVYIAAKWHQQKYLITYHNDALSPGLLKLFSQAHRLTAFRIIVGGAAKICLPSLDYLANSHLANLVEKRRQDVVELPNSVDTEKFTPEVEGDEVKRRYDLGRAKVLLFVGRLDKAYYYKGLEYLLKALRQIENEDVRLLVAGDGDMKGYYKKLSEELGIAQRVIFAGSVPHDCLPLYYAASNMVVLPSFAVESFGMPLIESMAMGKPVVATNIPGVRDVVEDGENGLLIEPKNAEELASKIGYLLENKEACQRMGRNGRRKAEVKYSWQSIGIRLEKIYREALESP